MVFCASSAFAQNTLVGAGAVSCGNWTEARAGRIAGGRSETFIAMISSWVQGYISSKNEDLFTNLPDYNTSNAFLDKYCRDNPLASIFQASLVLWAEIKKNTPR